MGTRICVMNGGRVAQVGAPLDVYWNPADTFVARFLGAPPMNLFTLPVTGDASAARVATGVVDTPLVRWTPAALGPYAGGQAVLGVRAEDLCLTPVGEAPGRIRGRVFAVEPLGAETLLALEVEGGAECTARLPRDTRATVGETVDLFFRPETAFLFDPETAAAVPARTPAAPEAVR